MNQDSRDQITWFLGTAVSLAVVAGMLTRFVLLPWLRDHLAVPLRQVEKQVTENSHANREPTVLDRIDDVQVSVKALSRVIDNHLEWSDRWTDVIEKEIALVQRTVIQAAEERKRNGP